MGTRLKGEKTVVAKGGKGIGKAIAKTFESEGSKFVIAASISNPLFACGRSPEKKPNEPSRCFPSEEMVQLWF